MNNEYSQPDFYRFNEDSIRLVDYVLNQNITANKVIDVGAGCGVIGLEFARRSKVREIVFLEVQSEYEAHIKENISIFLRKETKAFVEMTSVGKFISEERFDLILSNPPYYLPHAGRISPNESRAVARTFLIEGWPVFFQMLQRNLAKQGKAYIVLKDDPHLLKFINGICPQEFKSTVESNAGLMFVCFEYKLK